MIVPSFFSEGKHSANCLFSRGKKVIIKSISVMKSYFKQIGKAVETDGTLKTGVTYLRKKNFTQNISFVFIPTGNRCSNA